MKVEVIDMTLLDWAGFWSKVALILAPFAAAWYYYPWVFWYLLQDPLLGPLFFRWLKQSGWYS